MSRENYPRNDGPDPLTLALFVLLVAGLGLGGYVWFRSQQSLKIAQLQAEKSARAARTQAFSVKQLVATPRPSGETDQTSDLDALAAKSSIDLEAEVVRLERENAALRQELRTLRSESAVEP